MSNRTKTVIAIIVIVSILLGVYLLYSNSNSSESAISSQTAPASAAEISFLNLASKTESVTFDTSILADPRFAALVDIHTAIVPEPQGRTDPFAPLPGSPSSSGN